MFNDYLEVYGSCDLEKPLIPSRSRLYHLEPIGIGTPYVESLTSYITRLSEAHSVTSSSLFSQIIGYESKQTFIKNCSSRNIGTLFKRSRFVNGHGKIVQDIYQSLKKLTLQQNLDYLTVFRYSKVLSTRKLFKQNKSWCPACYEQWRLSNHTIYEPLLWTLEDVEICPHHYQPLQNSCPYCNQSSTWLSTKSRVGYCCKCDRWVGGFSQVNRNYEETELAMFIWIAQTLGKLISFISRESHLIDKANIPKALNLIIHNTYKGNIAAFSRAFGLPKNTVWMWCKGWGGYK
ncbi:MAG: TniQ family protein [Xenococcaceae cyanobacterium MO_207.B15]|nr:TniQ family protein [Xenococcaceae cyanobacterium MO_207.B15]